MTQQEEFEKWIIESNETRVVPNFIRRDENGDYMDFSTSELWIAWRAAKAQAVPKLIPVGERLPEHEDGLWSVPVIAMSDTGDIFILSYCGGWQRTQAFIDSGSSSITDWMYVPSTTEQTK